MRWDRIWVATGTALLAVAITDAAMASGSPVSNASVHYVFQEHRDLHDPTFNQLLAMNDNGVIAGYFGSGADAAHPNVGYIADAPYAQNNFHVEDFPGAAQTQVIGINDAGTTCGFYADPAGDNFGFVKYHGVFEAVVDPADPGSTFNQLLGLNNNGQSVGAYNTPDGNSHGYLFNFHTNTFSPINIAGAVSVQPTDINLSGTVVGYYTPATGPGRAFLRQSNGVMKTWAHVGASATRDYGINDAGRVVGSYDIGTGAAIQTFGFVRQNGLTETVVEPQAVTGTGAMTVYNGIANNGDLIGFYVDAAGNTDGVIATP